MNGASERFPRVLLVSWQRPDARYAGAEIVRRVVGALPSDRLWWAYLDEPGVKAGTESNNKAFPPRHLHWRFRRTAFRYFHLNEWQARGQARRIAEWALSFRPEIIWVLGELRAVSAAYQLQRRLGVPLHVTVHDAYEFAQFAVPKRYYQIYARSVRALLKRASSLDAVTHELVDHLASDFPHLAGDNCLVFPPSATAEARAIGSIHVGEGGSAVRIGFCGSRRMTDLQWEHFLDVLEAMPFDVEILLFTDKETFPSSRQRSNVRLDFRGYSPTEADIVKTFRGNGVKACYLGVSNLPDQRSFSRYSLSSKLTTYAACGLPVIVDGPTESAAWRLVREYGAGIRLDPQAGEHLKFLLTDEKIWRKAASGSARMCREKFDLEKNTKAFVDLLVRTSAHAER